MEDFLIYIGKVSIAAGVFYLAYLVLFEKQKHFGFNRIYLPLSMLISFIIPVITFTTIKYVELPTNESSSSTFTYLSSAPVEYVAPPFELEWFHYLFGLYLLGVFGFLFHLLLGHLKAVHIIRTSKIQQLFNHLINITRIDIHPFSFFNKIVLSEKTLSSPDLEMIVDHEKVHVREKHTFDILFTEIMFLLQWFNPFAWLIKGAVRNNLEYKTDDEIAKIYNPQKYQLAMVALVDKKEVAPFLTALNGSQLKNRIIMMKKKTENKFKVAKQLVVLPLLAILVMGLSNKEVKNEFVQSTSKVQVIVDGKVVPPDDENLSKVDFSKGINSMDVINALDIQNVVANSLNMAKDVPTLYIRTSDYIPGTDLDFEENTSTSIGIENTGNETTNRTEEQYYAIDNKIVTKAEFEEKGKIGFENVIILFGNSATDKYGEKYKNVTDATTGVPNFVIKDENEVQPDESIDADLKNDLIYSGTPKYTIADIEISGSRNFDKSILIELSGLKIGQEIEMPGDEIKSAISKYWDIGSFSDVKISASNIVDDNIWLDIYLEERQSHLNNNVQQNRIIKGKVTDIKGKPLAGATVLIKDKNTGTVTNSEGEYAIGIEEDGSTLSFYMNGYFSKDISVEDVKELNVELEKNIIRGKITDKDGNPLVQANVVQYNNRGRIISGVVTDNKGAFAIKLEPNVKALTISKKGYKSKEVNVEGKEEISVELEKDSVESNGNSSISLSMGQMGVAFNVGDSKINSTSKEELNAQTSQTNSRSDHPLIIVDGDLTFLPPELDFDFATATLEDFGKLLNIAPENIKSIEVLKDAASMAIYGDKAKNGVLVIKTNKKEGAINSILELRQFIAREIVFPTEARDEDNDELNMRFYVRVNNNGEITDIGENIGGDGEILPVEEIVVVALRPKNVVKESDIKNGNLMAKEAERVLHKLPDIEIPEAKGKILEFWFKFVLQNQ